MRIHALGLGLFLSVSCGSEKNNFRSMQTEPVQIEEDRATGFSATQNLTVAQGPVIKTTAGSIRGTSLGERGTQYLGIPFAQAPVGQLRWQKPQPVKPWTNILEAIKFGSACPQFAKGTLIGSEDCLFLNVWQPKTAKTLPVMVFVHGGANLAGSADEKLKTGETSTLIYDGSFLAAESNVIVVTINYRLGALGFFAQDDGEKSEGLPVANLGLEDQLAALNWVKENAIAFGGDPKNVTLFGESAGSWNSCNLLAAPRARGTFHRAILQSGACKQQSLGDALTYSKKVSAALGCKTLACMRAVDTARLLSAAKTEMEKLSANPLDSLKVVYPIAGDSIRPRSIGTVVAQRQNSDVPILIGSNESELVLPEATAKEFTCQIEADANLFSAANMSRLYRYEFSHKTANVIPAVHAAELGYLFGVVDRLPTSQTQDLQFAKTMRKIWSNFAKTGNANSIGVTPFWPNHTKTKSYYMNLSSRMELRAGSAVPKGITCAPVAH